MTQYIDKSALVSEIEKRIKETESMQPKFDQFWAGQISAFKGVLKILNTLEVKKVDLEKEKDDYWNKLCDDEFGELLERDAKWFDDIAKYFFELGLKAKDWKPSDEQIKALKETCDEHWESDGLDPLYTLWEQLKKLKGE